MKSIWGSSSVFLLMLIMSCAQPRSLFTFDKIVTKAPSTVTFVNKSQDALTYLWDFGDGNTSSEINPSHTFVTSGRFHINLYATQGKKNNMSTQEIIIDAPHQCLIEMQTSLGSMIIQLSDETPLHRDNFIQLAESGYYDGTLFHRVIKGFMIQGGDPDSKHAPAGKRLGTGGPGYTIPAEFVDTLVHIRGALAAARMGDGGNPMKASSGSQFYIVDGKPTSANQLESLELQNGIKYTPEAVDILTKIGGAPFLDKEYTVFGRVVKGLEVIDAITAHKTDSSDRPTTDAKIISVKVIK